MHFFFLSLLFSSLLFVGTEREERRNKKEKEEEAMGGGEGEEEKLQNDKIKHSVFRFPVSYKTALKFHSPSFIPSFPLSVPVSLPARPFLLLLLFVPVFQPRKYDHYAIAKTVRIAFFRLFISLFPRSIDSD